MLAGFWLHDVKKDSLSTILMYSIKDDLRSILSLHGICTKFYIYVCRNAWLYRRVALKTHPHSFYSFFNKSGEGWRHEKNNPI